MPRFSVIVPVYKVEKYLHQCVDSILSQDLTDFEVVLVDDGSPDRCPGICDTYGKKDSRVTVIHQKNGGLSVARNAGIRTSSGEYVLFLDSDDYYNTAYFLSAVNNLLLNNNVDMVVYQRRKFVDGTDCFLKSKPFPHYLNKEKNYDRLLYKLSKSDKIEVSACMKVIRRNILVDNNLYFKEGVFSEDVEWYFRMIPFVHSICLMDIQPYDYRLRPGSITHTISVKNIRDLLATIDNASIRYYKRKNDNLVDKAILNHLAYQFFIVLGHVGRLKGSANYEELISECVNLKWIANYSNSKKTILPAIMTRVFGVYATGHILGKYIYSKK